MVTVTKADGTRQAYDRHKVETSLQRAGANDEAIREILKDVDTKLFEGISTQEIYAIVYGDLKRQHNGFTSRYNLKKAIMDLGPTGYPFEKFFAGVLEEYGYKTEVNLILPGACVDHEVDILAEKDGKRIMIESKFHNRPGTKSDVRTALYTHARYLDLKEPHDLHEHWLVTNTKATHDAVRYGKCRLMKVITWDEPKDFSVRFLVEKAHLHPITALENISEQRKHDLLQRGTVFVKDYVQ